MTSTFFVHYTFFRGRREEAVANLCRLRGVSEPEDVEMEISAMEAAAKAENLSSGSSLRHKVSALMSRSSVVTNYLNYSDSWDPIVVFSLQYLLILKN